MSISEIKSRAIDTGSDTPYHSIKMNINLWCMYKSIERSIIEKGNYMWTQENVWDFIQTECNILILCDTRDYRELTQWLVDSGIRFCVRLCTRTQKRIILHDYENIKIRVVIKEV